MSIIMSLKLLKEHKKDKKEIIYFDMDGCVADFDKGYEDMFDKSPCTEDDSIFNKNCLQVPRLFRHLAPIYKGVKLVNLLSREYMIVFLTTPMKIMQSCKKDKILWIREQFGRGYPVIFSHNKADYAIDESSVLVDDMDHNLGAWKAAGGTAINIKEPIDNILKIIKEVAQ